jgi:hypothetical protein
MRNRTRNCLVVAGLTVTAFAVLLGSFVRRQLLGVKQIRNESRGQSFVLVSYGRDGRSDHLDYWHLRELNDNSPRARNICFAWDADQVMSDRGFHRCCGK